MALSKEQVFAKSPHRVVFPKQQLSVNHQPSNPPNSLPCLYTKAEVVIVNNTLWDGSIVNIQ